MKDVSPENCFLLKFYWGEPAVAFLLSSISNPNALNDIFYPNLYQLGFKSAFELTFNKISTNIKASFLCFIFFLYDNKAINIDCPLILDLILIICDTHFF